ncbi:lipocalin family protein [Acinetobacter nosocomialis]|nr:lipocalin family protein [Acinetobacter nosocomialis]SSP53448.1 lipocalin family protein [Acinetobacter nosocomialis]
MKLLFKSIVMSSSLAVVSLLAPLSTYAERGGSGNLNNTYK